MGIFPTVVGSGFLCGVKRIVNGNYRWPRCCPPANRGHFLGGVGKIAKKTVRDLDVAGKRVLVRVDFNVPVDKSSGQVSDDTRIRAALPTINYLLEQKAKVILASHLGRPKGKVDDKYKMDPVADRLTALLGATVKVKKVDDCVGALPQAAIEAMSVGDVLLLENVRFHPEEEKNDQEFARQMAALADVYVNDAFGTAHRAHASTEGVAKFLPAVAGFLMESELAALGKLLAAPERPFLAIMGGAKVSDKIPVIANLFQKVNSLIIGGGMANTFFSAMGYATGNSLVESDKVETAKNLLAEAKSKGIEFLLPVDVVIAPEMSAEVERKTVSANEVPDGWMVLDIGPQSVELFTGAVQSAKTVIWNGPMGVFEMEPFAKGTVELAKALAATEATTVIGGGDSVSAVKKAGVAEKMTHISTGGGASLEFLEGKQLPGVVALLER